MLFEEFLNFLLAWLKSRNWLRIAGLGVLVGCIPVAAISLVIFGMTTPISVLAANYDELIDEEMKLAAQEKSADEAASPNRNLQVPLRRILQLDAANDRIRYFVASELGQQGRTSLAAKMMREIAPVRSAGFPDAHAWLAAYALGLRSVGNEVDLGELMHDLEIAVNKSSSASPSMIVAYAALLNQAGRGGEGLALLRTRREQFPELNVAYAQLAEKLDEKDDLKLAIRDGREKLESRFKSGEGDDADFVQLVQLALFDQDFDRAVSICQGAVSRSPENAVFRQLYASTLLAKYVSLGEDADLVSRMQYLDAAFKANPANERVVAEVAKAIALGQDMPETLRSDVEQLLADGNAPAVAHLMLANNKLVGDDPASAIVHLELALRQMPNSAVVMNNLAIAILNARPEEIERAGELIEQSLKIPGSSPAMLASMLDTQGQVRLAQKDPLGAIDSFEKAIRLDRTKLGTRQRLADTYQEVGMTDLAAVQLRRIAEQSEQPN